MQVLPIFLVILAIVVSGYIFTSKHRFYFLRAIILFLVLLLLSTINFSIFFGFAALFIDRIHDMELGNLFLLLAALVILSGLLLYEGLKRFNKYHPISEIILTLMNIVFNGPWFMLQFINQSSITLLRSIQLLK